MNRQKKPSQHRYQDPAYRRAFQRLDEALEQNSDYSYADKIEQLGRLLFGEDWNDPIDTGAGALPK